MLADDIITKIDGEEVQGLTLNDAVDKMRGPVNTPITLTIFRKGARQAVRREADPRRDHRPVGASPRRGGRRRLSSASPSSPSRPPTACRRPSTRSKTDIGKDKLKGYVLDLRNNPGGLLDQAVDVSDAFLDSGEIVSTRGRDAGRHAALQRHARRPDRRQADRRAGQWRLGLGLGDRRRRPAGPSARDDGRHALLRQGLGADDHPARRATARCG